MAAGAGALAVGLTGLAAPQALAQAASKLPGFARSPLSSAEKQNTLKEITNYNNFYEFGTDKEDPARYAGKMRVRPWSIAVKGEVKRPRTYAIDDLLRFPLEERIYRLRCVEAWSMVIPWVGLRAEPHYPRRGADFEGEVRGVRERSAAGHHAGGAPAVSGMALPRGPAPRRGQSSAGHSCGRPLRRCAAQPERRAGAPGGAVEIRLQERQVHCRNPLRGNPAENLLEDGQRQRVWLLFQRQSRRSTIRAGARQGAPLGDFVNRAHADVQRLRGPGGPCTPAWT